MATHSSILPWRSPWTEGPGRLQYTGPTESRIVQENRVEGHALIFSSRTPKLQLALEQPPTGGCWNPPKNYTPHPRMKEKLQQDGSGGAVILKSNPIPAG